MPLPNRCIERVFLITLDSVVVCQQGINPSCKDLKQPPSCVFLQELLQILEKQGCLDLEGMVKVIISRTLMHEHQLKAALVVYDSREPTDLIATETLAIGYLFHCYKRASKETNEDCRLKCEDIICRCACNCITKADELYSNQNIIQQLTKVFFTKYFSEDGDVLLRFLEAVLEDLSKKHRFPTMYESVCHILRKLHTLYTDCFAGKLCSSHQGANSLKMMQFFVRNESLAKALLRYNEQSDECHEKTLFGTILSSSVALNSPNGDSNHLFDTPSRMTQSDLQRAELQLHMNTEMVVSGVYEVFMGLCRASGETKKDLLHWIGRVLSSNYGCSDGFMLNLSSVLLKMCEPFSQPHSPKLLKIEPVYCRHNVPQSSQRSFNHYCSGIADEAFLIPLESEDIDSIPKPEEYGFVTNLFFLTQLSLYLSLHATYEKYDDQKREVVKLQGLFRGQEKNPGIHFKTIKDLFEKAKRDHLTLRTLLTDPTLLRPVLKFITASTTYLTYLATGGDNSKSFTLLTFPISDCNTHLLGCMPEFMLTVITDAIRISECLKQSYMQDLLPDSGYIMDMVLVFMGSTRRMKSPHLRAKLALVLYDLMPDQAESTARLQTHDIIKEQLFTNHPNIERLSEALLKVFVSIESTTESEESEISVEFNEKLSYRQPMYKVMDYIWKIEKHQQAIMELCSRAMNTLDSADPPLFLKFTNLLVNDAHFLLDEALDYMKQIREKEMERIDSQITLTETELLKLEADLAHMARLARFHNTEAVDTTHTLVLLTSRCSELFCKGTMPERIAAMLNYFLVKLRDTSSIGLVLSMILFYKIRLILQSTGPKMSEFKVSDFQICEFKPDVVVSEICQIYLNLSESEAFCQAVCADNRSYSPKLFSGVERVLVKIHKPSDMIQAFRNLSVKITAAAKRQTAEEDLVSSAPEKYLDPLTGNLMKDPVTLPSSQVVMDKSTIARHLLNDQTDPYNRRPLTLDQVVPNTQLKQEINDWIRSTHEMRSIPANILGIK